MKCPFCGGPTMVCDTGDKSGMRCRRRRCLGCDKRFNTTERVVIGSPADHSRFTREMGGW